MSRLTDYMGRVSGEVRQRTGDVLRSRFFLFGLVAAVAATFIVPALSFLLVGGLLAGAAYVLSPMLPGRFPIPRLSFGDGQDRSASPRRTNSSSRSASRSSHSSQSRGSSSSVTLADRKGNKSDDQPKRKSDTPREKVPKGRKVGEPMVDQLIKKLTGAGLVVSTDWDFARKILNELPEKYNFLNQNHKKVYGFVYNGVIYINPKAKAVATPIHEYTHVWAEVLRQKNPDEWKHIVDMLKNDEELGQGKGRLWSAIQKAYPHLETDDEIADEVLATYSGRHGAELLREHWQKGSSPESVIESVQNALRRFWNDVCSFFGVHYPDKENIADKVLADFLQGVNPLDYAEEGREKLSDRFPLHEVMIDHEQDVEQGKISFMDKENTTVLTGDEARRTVNEILSAARKDEKGGTRYDAHLGTVGYFSEVTGDGDQVFSAFDNSTGDCWCEDFQTLDGARQWCLGEKSADEVRVMESNIDTIILSKDSFPVSKEPGFSPVADLPPYVRFDENGEMEIKMQFFDGYAFDTNPHGLGTYDRIALYYPTVAEVAKNPAFQEEIEEYTDRRWAEGSRQEQIFDIALKYGQAGRLHCPVERYDAAVKAVVERTSDRRARAFTPEQRGKIELAAASNGENLYGDAGFRQVFYDGLFDAARSQMKDVCPAWAEDAHQELRELSEGKVREEGHGLRR